MRFLLTSRFHPILLWFICAAVVQVNNASAQQANPSISRVCPASSIQSRSPEFDAGGIILTYFDRYNIWVYDVDRNVRYPLQETAPCGTNCHLSPDMRWFSYLNSTQRQFSKMRLNGAERTPLTGYATEVSWWDEDTLLVWTPTQGAYLQSESGDIIEQFPEKNVISIQPGGQWALSIEHQGDYFMRMLVNLNGADTNQAHEPVLLGIDQRYFNAAEWSPGGQWLAFTAPITATVPSSQISTEIFGIQPDVGQAFMWSDLTSSYGPVRINGHAPGILSWSPDGARIAFWIIPITGSDPETDTDPATIHILDIETGTITAYCGFTTSEHTPNPPRLIWSADGNHLAFGANLPDDERGFILLSLDTRSGIFTELSAGIYPALGNGDVVAWGLPPG